MNGSGGNREMTAKLKALDHLVLTVGDIAASVRFYTEVMGMQAQAFRGSDGTERQALLFGQQKINLHQAGQEFEPKAAVPMRGSADLCFLTDAPLEVWLAQFADHHVTVEEGPVQRTGATGAIMSLYVRDPDGNLIEVSTAA